MKKLVVPDIVTPKPTRYLIPGGWHLPIPHFTSDPEYEGVLTGVLMPDYQHDPVRARADARRRIDSLARNGWMNGLREFVIRCAVDYGRRFPHKVTNDRTLAGFDPLRVASLYIPLARACGRDGRKDVRNLLVAMAGEPPIPIYRPRKEKTA